MSARPFPPRSSALVTRVTIASRDPEDAGAVAAATGARVAASNAAAAAAGDIVILAIPATSFADVAAEIAPAVAGKTVVDVTNRIGFGADGPEIDTTSSNAEALADLLPEANVVKAFNTLFGSNMATRSPTASSSTASSPATTRPRRRRCSSSSARSGSIRSTSGRSSGRASSRACPSST